STRRLRARAPRPPRWPPGSSGPGHVHLEGLAPMGLPSGAIHAPLAEAGLLASVREVASDRVEGGPAPIRERSCRCAPPRDPRQAESEHLRAGSTPKLAGRPVPGTECASRPEQRRAHGPCRPDPPADPLHLSFERAGLEAIG